MKSQSLRPHTFMTSSSHTRHHAWLTSFSPRERHRLIAEDCSAKWAAFSIMIGVMSAGLLLLLISLWVIR